MSILPGQAGLIDRHELLQKIPEELAEHALQQDFHQSDRLFMTGTTPHSMLFLLEGEVRLMRVSYGGNEVIMQRIYGGFIAEASLYAQTYHCDAVAVSDGILLDFPMARFRSALETAEFRDFWFSLLSTEVRKLRARCERLALNGTAERIIHYLQSEGSAGKITLTQTKKAWAAELGVSHESLYRTLASLQRSNRIALQNNDIALVNP